MNGTGQGVPVPLPSGVRPDADDIGLLAIIHDGVNPVSSLITYSRSSDDNWALASASQRLYGWQFFSGIVYDVPERWLTSTARDAAGNSIPGSDIEPTRDVCWQNRGFLGLEGASTMVREAYGNTVDDAALMGADSGVSGLIEDDDH